MCFEGTLLKCCQKGLVFNFQFVIFFVIFLFCFLHTTLSLAGRQLSHCESRGSRLDSQIYNMPLENVCVM